MTDHRLDAFATRAVHAGGEPDEATGAISPPIYQTSTYAQDGVGRPRRGYEYARSQNPTRERLERAVADLEGGSHGIAFASGSAATAALAQLAGPGDEILVGDDVYGGTYRYFERVHRAGGAAAARYADLGRDEEALGECLGERTRLVWLETPSNPLLKVVDIAATSATVRERSAGRPGPLLVVDNTFASPALQRPLELGADVVLHSATKYLGGHSDAILGVVVSNDDAVADQLRFLQNAMGAIPGPFDCFLVLRGLRTLPLRMARHSANAMEVARLLAAREDVAWVGYPGLREGRHAHPRAEIAACQMRLADSGEPAFGGMVSFMPAAGGGSGRSSAGRAAAFSEATRLFTLAESLGGVESLVEVPAAMTHASVAASTLAVDPALVRLSVGIESPGDLLADITDALDRA
ncbi:MAG: aminotransferase class I/II-fold pyridoxal phosphate-dependent enzyme [Candidatus Limnocylindrales bacterium]